MAIPSHKFVNTVNQPGARWTLDAVSTGSVRQAFILFISLYPFVQKRVLSACHVPCLCWAPEIQQKRKKKKKMTDKVVPILKSLYSSQGDKKQASKPRNKKNNHRLW